MSSLSRSRASLHFNPRTPRGVRPLIMDAFIANANFNPRTPRGVRRTTGVYLGIPQRFQSTHPARGATIGIPAGHNPLLYFNPRTPRGVRRYLTATLDAQTSISIHAPREGCDESACGCSRPGGRFQSTHPARGATDFRLASDRAVYISIHAPREGCDRPCCTSETGRRYFNPRTPRGVRRRYFPSPSAAGRFQSTHPARGATPACPVEAQGVESFQSTHPARGATICHWSTDNLDITISIHAPREGCDISYQ